MNNKITEIEGLRGMLALWVYINHVIGHVGYSGLPSWLEFLRWGQYAVDLFVIVSGFVIFLLLDRKREGYWVFLIRRFFRLWPLFIVLYVIYMPTVNLSKENMFNVDKYYGTDIGTAVGAMIDSWWDNSVIHSVLHLFMVHGVVPDKVLQYSPSAFLGPAWSVSLEWQFYILAPLLFRGLLTRRWGVGVVVFITLAIIGSKLGWIPYVQLGAFFPFHADFFLIGILSYFVWKVLAPIRLNNPSIYFLGSILGLAVYFLGKSADLVPVAIWTLFFCGLLYANKSEHGALMAGVKWVFCNRIALFFGKISYSVYLVHTLVLVLVQQVLFKCLSGLGQSGHLLALLCISFPIMIVVSTLLHKYVEVPGIKIGGQLINWMRKNHRQDGASL